MLFILSFLVEFCLINGHLLPVPIILTREVSVGNKSSRYEVVRWGKGIFSDSNGYTKVYMKLLEQQYQKEIKILERKLKNRAVSGIERGRCMKISISFHIQLERYS